VLRLETIFLAGYPLHYVIYNQYYYNIRVSYNNYNIRML